MKLDNVKDSVQDSVDTSVYYSINRIYDKLPFAYSGSCGKLFLASLKSIL